MRLLVSVRSAAEVAAAIAGGADIVDAKEPARGSLGPVSARTLGAIVRALPGDVPLSVALGEAIGGVATTAGLAALGGALALPDELYVKLGLAGVRSASAALAPLTEAVRAASSAAFRPRVVAVAYADHAAAGSLACREVTRLAHAAGASGVLIDTWTKDGRDLFSWLGEGDLGRWVAECKALGLLTGVAGSLSADGVRRAADLGADVVGVRGAACSGGRGGLVEQGRVRALRAALCGSGVEPGAVA